LELEPSFAGTARRINRAQKAGYISVAHRSSTLQRYIGDSIALRNELGIFSRLAQATAPARAAELTMMPLVISYEEWLLSAIDCALDGPVKWLEGGFVSYLAVTTLLSLKKEETVHFNIASSYSFQPHRHDVECIAHINHAESDFVSFETHQMITHADYKPVKLEGPKGTVYRRTFSNEEEAFRVVEELAAKLRTV
jgi:hypothetical protein